MSERESDAIVVGGGLAGLAAAVAVAKAGLSVIHIVPKGPPDRRTSALMRPAVAYLQSAGLVPDPAAIGHPLTQIRIIDATKRLIRAPETLFDRAESGLDAFGWNFPNVKLTEAFEAARSGLAGLRTIETTLEDLHSADGLATLRLANGTTLTTGLVVGADGKKSRVRETGGFRAREHGFTQAALVCDLALARPIGGTSVEFHYEQGPFTLVPAGGNRANLVWIDDRDRLKEAQGLPKEELTDLLLDKSQRLFGSVELLTPTHMFPLSTLTVDRAGRNGVVLVGEAAHAFPPIGAQGLNLSLRDVADLAAALTVTERSRADFALAIADDFAGRRASDLTRTGTMVDTLFRSLLADFLPAQLARSTGLWALKLIPSLRKTAFEVGMGAR
ncbi:MAG TPA: FAD-dependent monooxygenase [Devosia sp.]|nr:FAD-dependent monooxygenase [Devosia sp.]